jgi:hypothetical protein
MSDRECPIEGCATVHPRHFLMCGFHWRQVPKPLRDRLWAAFKSEEGVLGEEYHDARRACLVAVEMEAEDG